MTSQMTPDRHPLGMICYEKDQTLPLTLHLDSGVTHTITAKVLASHEPSTMSFVLTVEFPSPGAELLELPAQAILKLYDRRFSNQLRSDSNNEPWSVATEQAFSRFVASGKAAAFVKRLREDDDFHEPNEGWSPVENEAYLHSECTELFSTELRAYELLQSFQGKQIPTLYCTVSLYLTSTGASEEALLTINGLLLEYIPGPTLSKMVDAVPRDKWQNLVDRAVQIVRGYSLVGILNKDVRCSNFIIDEAVHHEDDDYRVVMLDFALCEFRGPEQSDAEWGRAKWVEDEEGAIGAVMRTRLAKVGFELEYVPSHRWIEYAPGEDE